MKRRMLFVDRDRGLVEVEVESDAVASFIGRHHRRIRARLRGDSDALADFEKKRVTLGGQVFVPETDLQVLVSLFYAGELDYQDPYDTGFLEDTHYAEGGDDVAE